MKKIQSKITLAYLVVMVAVVVTVGILLSARLESSYKDRLVAELSARVDLLIVMLRADQAETDLLTDARIKDIARAANCRITLIDSSGKVLFDSDVPYTELQKVENHLNRPEVQMALRQGYGTNARHSSTVNKDFMYLARRVDATDAIGMLSHVRIIRLSQHLEEVQATVMEIRWNIVLVACGVLLLVVVVSILVSRRMASPMVAIARGVEAIRAGNLETRLAVRSNDEIGEIAQAVNELVDRVNADITKLKKLERIRTEFLGNVSHELRTPLFSLQGFLETLINGAVDDRAVNRDFLQKAYAHATRLDALLGDLITISQIESGEMQMSFRYFPLKEFLNGVVNDFALLAEKHKVTLKVESGQEGTIDVYGDKERLAVAIGNLIENAIKYNRPGGEVVVSSRKQDGRVRISVSDSGVGIAAEHLPRIFERFYRVDKNRSRDVGGTGLGLAIVKHIVEAHGGEVHVESAVAKGSTFSFVLKT